MDQKIVLEIIALEWEMFSEVNNIGGKASCQEDFMTFKIMRASQAEAWSPELLQSYYSDLLQAKSQNKNLMTEKYARMMETTFPEEYQRLAKLLPKVDENTLDQIERIIEIHLKWKIEIAEKYPSLTNRGRSIYTKDDSMNATSFETYLRCELRTCSSKTIQLYYDMTLDYLNRGENIEEVYLENMVKRYGYVSLENAEEYYTR